MTTHYVKVATIVVISLFTTPSVKAQTEPQIATEILDLSQVAGTFHFESPTDNMFFWSTAYIESLYADIEHLRQDDEHYRWEFTNDMTIVIYSRSYVESAEFIPNNSPYNKVGKL